MTPMMFSPSAASAGSESAVDMSDLLGGAQALPGNASAADESPFAAFDVALLAILEQVALSEAGQSRTAQQLPASSGETSLSSLWLQSFSSATRTPASGADAVDVASVPTDDDVTDIDEDAAVIAAMALTAVPPPTFAQAPSNPSAGSDAGAEGGKSGGAATGDAEAGWFTPHSVASIVEGAEPSEEATSAATGADELPASTDAEPASEPADHRQARVPDRLMQRAARDTSADARPADTAVSAHPQTRQTPEPQTPNSAAAATLSNALSALAAASQPTQSEPGRSATFSDADAQDTLRSGGHPAIPIVPASEQAGTDAIQSGSRDRNQHDWQGSIDATWLRRSASLESRLAPPGSFVLSPGHSLTSQSLPVNQVTTPTGSQFEMPAPAENLSRLVQSIRVQAREGISQASVRLNPEQLGEVTIAIRVEAGSVTAVVRAEAGDVRQWLRGQEESLRSALAEQGLSLDELVVEQDGGRRDDREAQAEEQQRRGRTRSRQTRGASFDVTA